MTSVFKIKILSGINAGIYEAAHATQCIISNLSDSFDNHEHLVLTSGFRWHLKHFPDPDYKRCRYTPSPNMTNYFCVFLCIYYPGGNLDVLKIGGHGNPPPSVQVGFQHFNPLKVPASHKELLVFDCRYNEHFV